MIQTTIEMGGTPRSFHFGIGFISIAIDRLGVPANKLQEEIDRNPYKALPVLILAAHAYHYEREDMKCPVTKADVEDWIDEAGGIESETVTEFIVAMGQSRTQHVPKQKRTASPKKKRTPKQGT